MNKKYLLLIGAAVAGYWIWSQKTSVAMLNYVINGVALNFNGVIPVLNVQMTVQNVSNQSYIINSFVGTLSANGVVIGNVSNFTPAPIAASSQTPWNLLINLNLIGTVSDLVTLITNGTGAAQNLVLQGYINASGLVVPVTLNYQVG